MHRVAFAGAVDPPRVVPAPVARFLVAAVFPAGCDLPAGGGSENRSTIGGAIGVVCGCATGIIGDDMGNGDVAAAGGATGIGAEPGNGLSDGAADPPPNTC